MSEDNKYERGDLVDDAILDVLGAGGSYSPLRDRVVVSNASEKLFIPKQKVVDDDGWTGGQNVISHELEHKRQFNYPGDYSSRDARRIAKGIDSRATNGELSKIGYSDAALPLEIPAHMKGSNAAEGSVGLQQASSPHPFSNKLNDEEKLWLLKNENKWQTDQDFLSNIDRFGIQNAKRIERVKNIGAGVVGKADDMFSKAWGYFTK